MVEKGMKKTASFYDDHLWKAAWILAGVIFMAGFMIGLSLGHSEVDKLKIGMAGLTIIMQHQNGGYGRK